MHRCFQLLTLIVFSAMPAFAGITYDFTSTTSGMSNQTIAGTAVADGRQVRVDIRTGDGVLFTNGSFVVAANGGQKITVVDPRAKTFYELDLSQILGGADTLLQQLGSDITVDVRNPRVSVSQAEDAGAIEGYPAKHSKLNTSYELAISAFGQPMNIRIAVDSDVWWTDRITGDFTNFLQMRGLRTGVDAVDRLLAAEAGAIKGFPLKQVTTTNISFGGNAMTSTTTSVVKNLRQAGIKPEAFVIPAGFAKRPNPIETMFEGANR